MRSQKKRRPTRAELSAMGATPGLMVRRVGPSGRSRLEQLAPESDNRRKDFARRLTNYTQSNEGGE